jgi:hypothetical protein
MEKGTSRSEKPARKGAPRTVHAARTGTNCSSVSRDLAAIIIEMFQQRPSPSRPCSLHQLEVQNGHPRGAGLHLPFSSSLAGLADGKGNTGVGGLQNDDPQ